MRRALEPASLSPRQAQRRLLWFVVLAAAIVLIVVWAGIAVLPRIERAQQTHFPAHTPVGTVQRYLSLLQSGEVDRAYGMTQMDISPGQFHAEFDSWSQSSHQVTLVSDTIGRNYASVTVDIARFSANPLGASEDTNRVTFTLIRAGTRWEITGPEYIPAA